ncbi:MAG: murein hydrolase activator EnvC family protein [Alphaproteobacteria bacterium]
MLRQIITYTITLLIICQPLAAQSKPPVPKSKPADLNTLDKELKEETQKKQNLEQQAKEIDKELDTTKEKLISIATEVQSNEEKLKSYQKRITSLEIRKSILVDNLNKDRASIARLILALERIRRMPPEAMLATPETPYKTAQSAMLMSEILPAINKHADKLKENLETLTLVSKELQNEKSALIEDSEKLRKQHEQITKLVIQRKKLYTNINDDLKAHELSIQKISLQAKNLKELVDRIKKEEAKEQQRKKTALMVRPNPTPKIEHDGNSRLPISGIVRTRYNQKDNLGAKSKGITIEGRPAALVVSPMNGRIQFTGSFKRYGNIVIIEHTNGYHSLVAGLETINSVVGDTVKSGEPIGLLPNSTLIPRPTLYYELRKNGKAINPSVKFADLG